MPQQITFEGLSHSFPDDFTEADISEALSTLPPGFERLPPPPEGFEYISTDPNAGEDYLSEDPNAGDSGPSGAAPVVAAAGTVAGAALPALARGGQRLIEEVATRPKFGAGAQKLLEKISGVSVSGAAARRANLGKQAWDVATGKQSIPAAAIDAGRNELIQQTIARAPGLLQRLAQYAAPRTASLAGVLGPAASVLGLGAAAAMTGADALRFFRENKPLKRSERLSQAQHVQAARDRIKAERDRIEREELIAALEAGQDGR